MGDAATRRFRCRHRNIILFRVFIRFTSFWCNNICQLLAIIDDVVFKRRIFLVKNNVFQRCTAVKSIFSNCFHTGWNPDGFYLRTAKSQCGNGCNSIRHIDFQRLAAIGKKDTVANEKIRIIFLRIIITSNRNILLRCYNSARYNGKFIRHALS